MNPHVMASWGFIWATSVITWATFEPKKSKKVGQIAQEIIG